jgi:hypothetical protein
MEHHCITDPLGVWWRLNSKIVSVWLFNLMIGNSHFRHSSTGNMTDHPFTAYVYLDQGGSEGVNTWKGMTYKLQKG